MVKSFLCLSTKQGRRIQGDTGGQVDVVGGDSIGHFDGGGGFILTCVFLNVYWVTGVWIRHLNLLDFCVWCWMRSEFYKRGVDTRDELLACVFFCAESHFSHPASLKHIYIYIYIYQWLRWSRGSVLAFSTEVLGFKPGRSRRIFRAKKSSERLPSEGK